jgi:voltage-dependent calcium channel L type alpha-1D
MRRKALGCIGPHNPIRRAAWRLVRARWFDTTIDVCIVINCVTLAMRSPSAEAGTCGYAPDAVANGALLALDVLFTAIFCAEAALKILVYGAISHPGAYLRNGWNLIDFTVAILAFLAQLPRLCERVRPHEPRATPSPLLRSCSCAPPTLPG